MKNTLKVILLAAISFSLYFILDDLYFNKFRKWLFTMVPQFGICHLITYTLSGIPLFIGTKLIQSKNSIIESLGLTKSIFSSLVFAILCTLPLFIGFSFVFEIHSKTNFNMFIISILAAGFFEELFFRGFLFGLLFKNSKLGFIPSVFFGALYFGLIHLYQSNDLSELIGIFTVTFLGAILFAWLYSEWNYNLWYPIFIHIFMNLSWEIFAVSETALGNMYANIFRIASISFIIFGTIYYKKRKSIPFEITKANLWYKKQKQNMDTDVIQPNMQVLT